MRILIELGLYCLAGYLMHTTFMLSIAMRRKPNELPRMPSAYWARLVLWPLSALYMVLGR